MAAGSGLSFAGVFYDGQRSRPQEVICELDHQHVTIRAGAGQVLLSEALAACAFTAPLGSSRRFLRLPGGGRLQVDDKEAALFLDQHLASHQGLRVVHLLESHWRLVAVSLVGLVCFVWLFMALGIPMLAKRLAMATPVGLTSAISNDTLAFFDKRFFAASALSGAQQAALKAEFDGLCRDLLPGQQCSLLFRQGGSIGANAFALPAGLVIVTDELVDFAKSRAELAGVLAHELVHVKERHGLRHVIQQAGVFMVISTLLGDMTSLSSLGATLPMLLVESGYSRAFEQEADEMACRYLLTRGQGVQDYAALLQRLTRDDKLPAMASFLASHPEPAKRLAHIAEIAEGYGRK